jgi:hypothetical protein
MYIKLLSGMYKNLFTVVGSLKGKRPPQALHHINQFRFQNRNDSIFLGAEVMAGTFALNLIWIGRF